MSRILNRLVIFKSIISKWMIMITNFKLGKTIYYEESWFETTTASADKVQKWYRNDTIVVVQELRKLCGRVCRSRIILVRPSAHAPR